MMSLENMVAILEGTGMDVAYRRFEETNAPEMPFITYQEVANANFIADNKVFVKVSHLYVTLWTSKKDITAEQALEQALDDHDIPWSKNESYLESEKCYEITYEVEV